METKENSESLTELNMIISQYSLDKYRDEILEIKPLTLKVLLNILNIVWEKHHNIDETVRIFVLIGYPGYNNRCGNERYLVHFVYNWMISDLFSTFSKNDIFRSSPFVWEEMKATENKDYKYNIKSQRILLSELCKFDKVYDIPKHTCPIDQIKHQDINVDDFYPFSYENVFRFIDAYIQSSYTSASTKQSDCNEDFETLKFAVDKRQLDIVAFYGYLINRVNSNKPYNIFSVCAYYRWIKNHSHKFKEFLQDFSDSEIDKTLKDFAIFKYGNSSPFIPNNNDLTETIDNLILDKPLTDNDLIEFWMYVANLSDFPLLDNFFDEKRIPNKFTICDDCPENGTFYLPWNYVRYVDGKAFFYHPLHYKGDNATLPYSYVSDAIFKLFNELPKRLLWSFPSIKCIAEKGKIIKIDNESALHVIYVIRRIFEHHFLYSFFPRDTFSKIRATDSTRIESIAYLRELQLPSYPIHKVQEKSGSLSNSNYETGWLFTIAETHRTITVVYENTIYSRATLVFTISKNKYESAIKEIQKHFKSDIPRKRTTNWLDWCDNQHFLSKGIIGFNRITHSSNIEWRAAIRRYLE